MSENLNLSIDSDVMHDFSRKSNKSLSKIIEDYFIELREKNNPDLPQDLQELYGIFEGMAVPVLK